jgi:hypothetical protein
MIPVAILSCKHCSKDHNDVSFLKDKSNQPLYFHLLNKTEAVPFCSAECASLWSLENKEKIWDRKNEKNKN